MDGQTCKNDIIFICVRLALLGKHGGKNAAWQKVFHRHGVKPTASEAKAHPGWASFGRQVVNPRPECLALGGTEVVGMDWQEANL